MRLEQLKTLSEIEEKVGETYTALVKYQDTIIENPLLAEFFNEQINKLSIVLDDIEKLYQKI